MLAVGVVVQTPLGRGVVEFFVRGSGDPCVRLFRSEPCPPLHDPKVWGRFPVRFSPAEVEVL